LPAWQADVVTAKYAIPKPTVEGLPVTHCPAAGASLSVLEKPFEDVTLTGIVAVVCVCWESAEAVSVKTGDVVTVRPAYWVYFSKLPASPSTQT
jgi:hypothetical protein